jgi:hypothetical protein
MRRFLFYLATVLLTFGVGISSWFFSTFNPTKSPHVEPLRIHVSLAKERMNESFPNPKYHIYEINVENVGDKTIQGFALIYEDSYGRGYLSPCFSCKDQILRPGETKTRMVGGYTEGLKVWLDEVRFAKE